MFVSGIIGALILFSLTAFVLLVPSRPTLFSYLVGAFSALVIIIHFVFTAGSRKKRVESTAFLIPLLSLSMLFIILPLVFAAALYYWGVYSFFSWVLLISLGIVFYNNFLFIPLAVYHKYREKKQANDARYYPSLTVLIPAFNEEKVLRRTVEAVLASEYPRKEVIVIDDGSIDKTYRIAQGFKDCGVKVIPRPNGGKAIALNHGIKFAQGEIVVVVDADSQITRDTLAEVVQPFRNPDVAAVAGNIKVLNRMNWLTKCQALEYIASINLYRRALDVFGSVSVVPGALGAYRRDILESGGFYDADTLVEDFDVTMKALKTGYTVQACNRAVSYTEAPQTVGDFIKQRLRWYRGNFQALWKHRDAAMNSRYGFLQKLAFPYMFISMTFIPLAGLVNIAAIVMTVLDGAGLALIPVLVFFFLLQYMISLLAIRLEGEDRQLALYSPLLVIGYKNVCDFVMMRSFFDVVFRKKLKWTSVRRTGARVSKSAMS
jgi:cellulose synthase/poly-beta-1,6-N-acetylglucosamine synthase-like glycosyltransferase